MSTSAPAPTAPKTAAKLLLPVAPVVAHAVKHTATALHTTTTPAQHSTQHNSTACQTSAPSISAAHVGRSPAACDETLTDALIHTAYIIPRAAGARWPLTPGVVLPIQPPSSL